METNVNTSPAVTTRSVGVKFGLISALIGIVFFLAQALTGQNAFDNSFGWKTFVSLAISVVIIVLAHKNFKDNGDGYMSYGQGVMIGFWIALVSVLLNVVITYLYINFVDNGVMDLMYQQQSEEMSKKGMPDDQIEMAIGWTKALFWPMFIIAGLFFGVLLGVIVSIFTQKKNPQPAF